MKPRAIPHQESKCEWMRLAGSLDACAEGWYPVRMCERYTSQSESSYIGSWGQTKPDEPEWKEADLRR